MSSLFGMVVNQPQVPGHFPSVPFTGLRIWDTETTWKDIETAPGVFEWGALDAVLAAAAGKEVLYTFGKVPAWASGTTNPAAPPKDISTGNTAWKYFVANLVLHSLESGNAKIAAYEVWNEPNLSQYWTGTEAQLVQMAKDAVTIIRDLHAAFEVPVTIVGPACDGGGLVKQWQLEYYLLGGPADVLNFHGYLDDYKTIPSSLAGLLKDIAIKKSQKTLPNLPVWFTEGSWGEMSNYAAPLTADAQVAYLAQMYLQMWLAGVERFYWYAWDSTSGWGQLWTTAGPTPAGVAYGVLAGWLNGSLITAPAAVNANGTWTAPLALLSGATAQIVWNPNAIHSLSIKALTYATLDGKTATVKNGSVTVSAKPILLLFV